MGLIRREWPLITVLGLVLVGLIVVVDGHFRRGCIVIAFALFQLAVIVPLSIIFSNTTPARRPSLIRNSFGAWFSRIGRAFWRISISWDSVSESWEPLV